jgi:importin-4
MAVAALAATAVAAEIEFVPYVPGVAALMTNLMQLRDPHLFSLRGRALECMGHIAIAVGRDYFQPYFAATMQCAMEGLSTESTDLQEFAYAVFANLAKVMKDGFAPALPELVPHLIQVIEQDEGQLEAKEEDVTDFGGLDDSDDDEEGGGEDGNYILHVRTALLEVKKGAITAMGEMASHTGTAFCPYLEACMQVLQRAASNWHPLIKAEVADAFPSLIVPSIAAYHNGEIEWTKGDTSGTSPMSAHTQAIVGAVMAEEIVLLGDDDKGTVAKACAAIQSVIEICGPNALIPVANDVLSGAHTILLKQAPCQTADAMYGEFPDDDDDHDVVLQAACDLVGAFARVMGLHFAQYLPQFLPAICEYGKSSRPPSDRSMAVGCLSELAQELNGAVYEHWHTVFRPACLAGLTDDDDSVKRNAAFCVGVCCEHLGERITGDYPAILQLLGNVFNLHGVDSSDAAAACVDNAAAAVARMIMASPGHVPMAQVLPVLLRALPLMQHPDALANSADMKRLFAEASQDGNENISDGLLAKLRGAL